MTFKATGAIFKNTPEKLKQRLCDRYDARKNILMYPLLLQQQLLPKQGWFLALIPKKSAVGLKLINIFAI